MPADAVKFSASFWSDNGKGFEKLVQKLQQSVDATKEEIEYFSTRLAVEEAYCKGLIKVSKENPLKSEFGSIKSVFDKLNGSIETVSRSHSAYASKIKEELQSPLWEFRERQKKMIKQVQSDHERYTKALKKEQENVDKLGKEYVSRCKEMVSATEKASKAQGENLQKKDLDKILERATKSKVDMLQAETEYKDALVKLESVQDAFDAKYITICDSVQQSEEERSALTQSCLKRTMEHQLDMLCRFNTKVFEKMAQTAEGVDCAADLAEFVAGNGTQGRPAARLRFQPYFGANGQINKDVTVAVIVEVDPMSPKIKSSPSLRDLIGAHSPSMASLLHEDGDKPQHESSISLVKPVVEVSNKEVTPAPAPPVKEVIAAPVEIKPRAAANPAAHQIPDSIAHVAEDQDTESNVSFSDIKSKLARNLNFGPMPPPLMPVGPNGVSRGVSVVSKNGDQASIKAESPLPDLPRKNDGPVSAGSGKKLEFAAAQSALAAAMKAAPPIKLRSSEAGAGGSRTDLSGSETELASPAASEAPQRSKFPASPLSAVERADPADEGTAVVQAAPPPPPPPLPQLSASIEKARVLANVGGFQPAPVDATPSEKPSLLAAAAAAAAESVRVAPAVASVADPLPVPKAMSVQASSQEHAQAAGLIPIPIEIAKREFTRRSIRMEGTVDICDETVKAWATRWAALEGGYIWLFESQADNAKPQGLNKPKAMVSLAKSTVELGNGNLEWAAPDARANLFTVTLATKRRLVLSTEASEDMWAWVDALQRQRK